jgi:hypothetical protein
MRFFICVIGLFSTIASAAAAPPASCVNKFAGEWLHNGNGGNRGTLTRDGRAICTENTFCQSEGTWTCAGDTMTYTTSLGSWVYTLMPDGSITANGGVARATRIGRAPASGPKHDYGAASNVTADVLGIDRTERPKPAPATAQAPKPTVPQSPPVDDPERQAAARYAHTLFGAGQAAVNEGRGNMDPKSFSTAEDRFSEAAVQYRKAGDAKNEKIALNNERLAKEIRQRLESRPPVRQTRVATSTKPSKMQKRIMKDSLKCEMNKKRADDYEARSPGNEATILLRARMKEVGCPD